MKMIAFIIFLLLCLLISFLILKYLYRSNPRKWRSMLFTKDDTFKNAFHPKNNKNEIVKKQNKVFLFISLLFSLVGAIIYKNFPATFFNFMSIGLILASINILFYFYFAYKNKVQSGDDFFNNNIILIVGGITLIIPYFIFFTLFSILLSGFKIPFSY